MLTIQSKLKNLGEISKTPSVIKFAIILVISRSILLILVQSIFALFLYSNDDPNPWESSASWWTVYATFVDLGCLALVAYFLKKENRKILSLMDFEAPTIWKDIKFGLIIFIIIFPIIGLLYPIGVGMLLFDESTLSIISGQLAERVLPKWAYIYSVVLWWIIWSITLKYLC